MRDENVLEATEAVAEAPVADTSNDGVVGDLLAKVTVHEWLLARLHDELGLVGKGISSKLNELLEEAKALLGK